MRWHLVTVAITLFALSACGGSQASGPSSDPGAAPSSSQESSGESGENVFHLQDSDTADQARGEHPSQIESTATHAAMRFFVVNPDAGPIEDIVIKMTGPDGTAYFTGETDSVGFAEVLVPAAQSYEIEFLSLGRRNISASVEVPEGGHQDIRLTLRYRSNRGQAAPAVQTESPESEESQETAVVQDATPPAQRFVLDGVHFDTASATIRPESYPRLDRVLEFMTHRVSARIRIAGHTDNVGSAESNQSLSEARAQSVREYLISHGIDATRIEAVGFGDQQPVASNDSEEGRQRNRRIEAIEL